MDFCPECGKILLSEKNNDEVVLKCGKCGYKRKMKEDEDLSFTEEIKHDVRDMTAIIDQKEMDKTRPTKEMYCPKCKKKTEISFWQLQTRSADESPTRFFKCTECTHTWREYD